LTIETDEKLTELYFWVGKKTIRGDGKTDTEAIQKCVIKVLEEEK